MQNIENNGKTLKDLQKFPDVFTFKSDVNFAENISRTGKYISISATTEVWTYEELESLYTAISKLEGLKFYV